MVKNPSGKPIRSQISEEEVTKYRLELLTKKDKGKGKASEGNPQEEEDGAIASMDLNEPSLSSTLGQPLRDLTLGSSSEPAIAPATAAPATTALAATSAAPTASSLRRLEAAGPSSSEHPQRYL